MIFCLFINQQWLVLLWKYWWAKLGRLMLLKLHWALLPCSSVYVQDVSFDLIRTVFSIGLSLDPTEVVLTSNTHTHTHTHTHLCSLWFCCPNQTLAALYHAAEKNCCFQPRWLCLCFHLGHTSSLRHTHIQYTHSFSEEDAVADSGVVKLSVFIQAQVHTRRESKEMT